jgi:hypothetical protein
VFLEYVLSENDPSFEQNYNCLRPDVQKGSKILKMPCLEFQTDFAPSITCRNFRLSYQVYSCCLWSVECEGCGRIGPILQWYCRNACGIGWSFSSSLSVCPVCNVLFVLFSQETQAFRRQSRQVGEKVRHQFCHGGRVSVYSSSSPAVW